MTGDSVGTLVKCMMIGLYFATVISLQILA